MRAACSVNIGEPCLLRSVNSRVALPVIWPGGIQKEIERQGKNRKWHAREVEINRERENECERNAS